MIIKCSQFREDWGQHLYTTRYFSPCRALNTQNGRVPPPLSVLQLADPKCHLVAQMYRLTSFRTQNVDCTWHPFIFKIRTVMRKFFPHPSVWSQDWGCIDASTEILVSLWLLISLEHWIFLIYLFLPSRCRRKNAENVLSTRALRYIFNAQQLVKVNNYYCFLSKTMSESQNSN